MEGIRVDLPACSCLNNLAPSICPKFPSAGSIIVIMRHSPPRGLLATSNTLFEQRSRQTLAHWVSALSSVVAFASRLVIWFEWTSGRVRTHEVRAMTSAEGFCCPDGTHWSIRTTCCDRWYASAKIPPLDQRPGLSPFPGVVLSLPCTPPAPYPLAGLHSLVDGGYQKRGLCWCWRSKTNTRESCHR